MKKIIPFLFLAIGLVGCAGGPGIIEVQRPVLDPTGKQETVLGVKQWEVVESTESIEIAKAMAAAAIAVNDKEQIDPCAGALSSNQIVDLKEQGQVFHFMSQILCRTMHETSQIVKAARDNPTSIQGEIAQNTYKTIAAIEESDAKEHSDNVMLALGFVRLAGVWVLVEGVADIAKNAGDRYSTGDIQMSNSGATASGGEGGASGFPDARSQVLNIGSGNQVNEQTGVQSSAQALGDKSPAFESPSTSGAPIFTDADNVKTETSLF